MLRRTGRKTRPWKRPNTTVRRNTLKKTMNAWDWEKPRRMRARKVVMPPLAMAVPMLARAEEERSLLEPEKTFHMSRTV